MASAPEGQRGDAALEAGGRLAGGAVGAVALGKVGAVGGPWGAGAGVLIGGIVGSIAGEEAVNALKDEITSVFD